MTTTAFIREELYIIHPSGKRVVIHKHTYKEMVTVFLLAQRDTLHVHLRKDIECINTYTEGITLSTKRER